MEEKKEVEYLKMPKKVMDTVYAGGQKKRRGESGT